MDQDQDEVEDDVLPVQGWLEGELLQLQWNLELESMMARLAKLCWLDPVEERTPENLRMRRRRRRRSVKEGEVPGGLPGYDLACG